MKTKPKESAIAPATPAGRCIVETLVGKEWENCWTEDEKPLVFASPKQARAAIAEHKANCKAAGLPLDQHRITPEPTK